jgi:hypothetical protein
MQKMKLNVDALAVDSFSAGAGTVVRGTVRANDAVTAGSSCLNSCYTCAGQTCVYTGSPCVYC